jgi:tRNA1(Val) A37 N6-methylase TrmN6
MKDTLCSYYTNSEEITSYMVARLGINDTDIILEPSAGEGIFIDEIIKTNKNVHIDALDIDEKAIDVLHQKYNDNPTISVRKTDTLFDSELDAYDTMQLWLKQTDALMDEQLDYFSVIGGHYTKVIGNPPYGAWQDYEKRDLLKKKYAGQYVRETYSLFLLRCLSVLKVHGRLSFIVPDTFLFLNLHSRLREMLLTKSKIDEILIFPSKFFPGVGFGYSNLSIITLERCEQDEAISNTIRIIQGFQSPHEFSCLYGKRTVLSHLKIHNLRQGDILNNPQHRFIIGDDSTVSLLNTNNVTLGDVADIVTGFYTGNNKKFIRVLDDTVKGAKGYTKIDTQRIFCCTSTQGIDTDEGYIPYIKSSSKQRYLREKDEWFVRWDIPTISFYNTDKKARFQNTAFYFNTGIGIPMVKSSTIRAFLMENRVFDQSIVGIFPKNPDNLNYLLALMNSDSINQLIHIINPTANNSSNYVKQLPYIEPDSKTKQEISALVEDIFASLKKGNQKQASDIHKTINIMISGIYGQTQG